MVSIAELWQPILLSTVIVFIASSIMNMLLPHHRGDFAALPQEDAALAALRQLNIPPGDYMVPRAGSVAGMKDPAFKAKLQQGPVGLLRLRPGRTAGMGPQLLQWLLFVLLVGISAAYLASRTLAGGADYLTVFRVTGFVACVAYCYAQLIESIWYSRRWRTTWAAIFDGLIYALLTGGVFGWLWPKALPSG